MRFDYLYSIKSLVRLQRIVDSPLFHQGAVNTVMFKSVFVEMLIISSDIYDKKRMYLDSSTSQKVSQLIKSVELIRP